MWGSDRLPTPPRRKRKCAQRTPRFWECGHVDQLGSGRGRRRVDAARRGACSVHRYRKDWPERVVSRPTILVASASPTHPEKTDWQSVRSRMCRIGLHMCRSAARSVCRGHVSDSRFSDPRSSFAVQVTGSESRCNESTSQMGKLSVATLRVNAQRHASHVLDILLRAVPPGKSAACSRSREPCTLWILREGGGDDHDVFSS